MKKEQNMMQVTLCSGKSFVIPDNKENRAFWKKHCDNVVFESVLKQKNEIVKTHEIITQGNDVSDEKTEEKPIEKQKKQRGRKPKNK